jgi:hypothetical protein
MSTTPRTDEQVLDWTTEDGSDIVFASMARELETELASMSIIAEKWEADALRYAKNAEYWQSRAEKAEFDLAHARVMVRVLRDALEGLRDEQNGAPYCTREEKWKQAMDRADAALAQTKEASK